MPDTASGASFYRSPRTKIPISLFWNRIFNANHWKLGLSLASIGFILFLVRQFYDGIIMKLCPEGMGFELGVG
ncbi:MAG: hypothetical protein ACD_62C00679G0004 [uncultured bacterium]|nr:MAG: hypothetical protein ACD_62C00679G0004 [uncultured bacterium]